MNISVDAEYLEELEKKAKRHDFFEGYIKGIEVAFAFVEELVKDIADRKTENSSEIPNNCETCRFELYCPEMCEGCCEWDSHYEPKDEPLDKDINVRSKDEFKQFDREDLILLIECQKERIAELLAKDEPKTCDTCRFDDRYGDESICKECARRYSDNYAPIEDELQTERSLP